MDPKNSSIKIHPVEMESLLNLKALLDQNAAVASYAEKYQKLSWDLKVLKGQDGVDLEVNLEENPETWINRLWQAGLLGAKINVGLRTGHRSQVMVLEVLTGAGETVLDRYGPWRSECIAALGARRERHFYAWGPEPLVNAAPFWETPEIKWFGEGQVVPVPPSFGPEMQENWRWQCPPWEKPPQSPSRGLIDFLQHRLSGESQAWPEVNLSWQEIYCLAAPHEPLLKALSASYPTIEDYYQGILEAAVIVGIKAPEVLMSLLWHAPRVQTRQHPEIWDYLRQLVAAAQAQPGRATTPEDIPWELFLDNALSLARETAAAGPGLAADNPGPPAFPRRHPAPPTRPGTGARTPFSCRNLGKYLSND